MYRGVAFSILLLVILGALYIPIKIPYDLVSIGNIQASEEWRLMQETSGSFSATQQNNKTGMVQRFAAWQFERGDLSGMELVVKADTFGQVICGDTIARMYSSVIQQQILTLENQLKVKEAEIADLSTGEKTPIIQEAQSKLLFAQNALLIREKELNIAQKLKDEGVIASIEFERIKNIYQLAKIDITTAEKALDIANTGVKSQTIGINTAEILTLRKQISFLKNRSAGYSIVAPFDATVSPIQAVGEVLILKKTSECIVTIPVKVEEMQFIKDDVKIDVKDPITNKIYQGKIYKREHQTQILGGRSVTFLKVLVQPDTRTEQITLGTSAQCTLHCGELNQREYLNRILHFSLSK
jgi:hypothetical protein